MVFLKHLLRGFQGINAQYGLHLFAVLLIGFTEKAIKTLITKQQGEIA